MAADRHAVMASAAQHADAQTMAELLRLVGGGALDHRTPLATRAMPVCWAEVANLARTHRVVPQLHTAVAGGRAAGMDDVVRLALQRHAGTVALNARFMVAELLRITQLFESRSIPVIAFKGPVLGAMAYGTVTAREFADLDLLVRSEDYPRAKQALAWRGLSMVHTTEQESRIAQAHFCSADERVHIDLHQRLAPYDFPGAIGAERLWSRVMKLELPGGVVTTLAPPASLLTACLQAAKNRRKYLYYLADIAALVARHGDDCVRSALELAVAWRMRRIFLVGVQSASELLAVELPGDIRQRATSDPVVTRLVGETRESLHGTEAVAGFLRPRHRPRLLLRDRAGDRLLYILRISPYYARWILTPNAADRGVVALPRQLAFLYPVVRLARLAVMRARHQIKVYARSG